MKLYFKQRFFSWFDSYDIYHEDGSVAYTVEGKLSWGHCLHILSPQGEHIATVQQRVLTFLPKFELYVGDRCVGEIRKEFTLFRPSFSLDFCGWTVDGSFMEWDYTIQDGPRQVASISKELFHWTDTYTIDVHHRRGGPRRRAVRPDGGAGHRRGEMLAELKQTAPGGRFARKRPPGFFLPAVPFPQMYSGDFS